MELQILSVVVFNILIGLTVQHLNSPPGIPPRQQQQHMHQASSGQGHAQPPSGQGHAQPPAHQGQGQAHNQDLHFQGHEGGFGRQDVHNVEHIQEHLKEVVDKPTDQMTDEELEFHYFKLHDYDSNNKLDGIEITKAITHFHHEEQKDDAKEAEKAQPPKVFTDAELINIIDLVMKEDDFNDDGYIEYPEFVKAQRKNREDETKKNAGT